MIFERVARNLSREFVIIPHIYLKEIFEHKFDEKGGFKNPPYYQIDMLICLKEYMTPQMGVEFDGEDHKKEGKILRDILKNPLFKMAKLPFVRVYYKDIDERKIYNFIKKEFQVEKLCKKCGSPMIIRNGMYGDLYVNLMKVPTPWK
ncbi:DUF2726 domain-containing protein [Clostridium sp. LP20]|uniref:DUF2726 domain-containing protein n=1 Tax=Clostridium sp. LP20 TaxID=3418665 RepID=UPI003EE4E13F